MEQLALSKNGKIEDNPLIELLREAIAEGLTGAFRVSRERVKTVIYCHEGAVVYVVSNVRSQQLSECLRRWGVLTDEQIASLEAKNSDFEFAQEILKRSLIPSEDLMKLFERQSLETLRPSLSWTAGEWEFDGRVRIVEAMRFGLSVKEILIESARQLSPDVIAARFTNPNEKLSPVPIDSVDIQLQPIEGFILSRLDTPLQLNELLLISGMPENVTLHALYSLALCGYVTREWKSVFSDSELEVFRAAKVFKPQTVPAQKKDDNKQEQKPSPPEQKPLPKQEKKIEVDPRRELERFLLRVENAQSFYDVLGLGTKADESEIKRAYHQAAKSYHPDRFHNEAGTDFHSRLQKVFARLAQAYDTLNDKTLRASYDKKLASGLIANQNAPKTPAQIAEQKFQQAMMAMQQNNLAQALPLFGQAVRLAPNQARYHAQYGQALIKNPQLRKQAEAEFQEAIKCDEKNITYRVLLARFYRDMKLFKRAESEAQRALSMDPNNREAQRLLDSLKNI